VLEVLDEHRVLRWATEDVSACLPFVAAAPLRRRVFSRNYDERTRGESYKAEWYDAIIGAAFRQVAANADLAAATTEKALAPAMIATDTFTLARIARDREAAVARYLRDRDAAALDAAMRRLDAEVARSEESDVAVPTRDDVLGYLSNLSRLWEETETEGRRAIAEATFDHLDVLGLDVIATPSAEAEQYGWGEVFGRGTLEVPVVCSNGHSGRGERNCAVMSDAGAVVRFVRETVARERAHTA
jgi:hypothetical protein